MEHDEVKVSVRAITREKLADALEDLARLRIEVFRDYPYLYDGSRDYESNYLKRFAKAKDAVIIAARDGERIVGCATGSALGEHHEAFAAPVRAAGYDLSRVFYFGESVLLSAYRGQGIGHAFFDQREAHARSLGYAKAMFCSVVRANDHPARPADYRPLDAFWEKRGYRKLPDVVAQFAWTDLGQPSETEKSMQFWMRDL